MARQEGPSWEVRRQAMPETVMRTIPTPATDESEQRENTFVWRTLSESVTDLLDLVNQSAEISDTGTGCFGQRMQPCQQYLHIMIVTELKKDELSVRTLAEILMK